MSSETEKNKLSELTSQTKIAFDKQLMQQKARLIEEFIRTQNCEDNVLIHYPNQRLKRIAQSQIKQQGNIKLHKNTSTIYFGEACNDLYHGYGLLIYKSTNIRFYQGSFQNNCKYGYGLQYINGDVYVGKFINNKPQDSNGIFIWTNDDIYYGSFVNGMKHGQGKWQSGQQFYSGTWKFNKPQGYGSIKSALSEYNGQVKNGYKHGKGLQLFSNGDRYEGYYSNGKPEGKGTYSWNNGSIYKGDFKNGLRFGYGVWQFGAQRYQGSYINDKRNGQGTYTWAGGSYYQGQFVEDLRHGIGEMHWEQGSYYKGQWFEGIQNGMGQIWEKGQIIQKGFYQNGKLKLNSVEDNTNKLSPASGFVKKSVSPKNSILPIFKEKKRFNSYQANRSLRQQQKKKPEKASSQLQIMKKSETKIPEKKEGSRRYSVLQKLKQKKDLSQNIKAKSKRNSIEATKLAKIQRSSKERAENQFKKAPTKDSTQKNILKQSQGDLFSKRVTIPKIDNAAEKQAALPQNQLSPINWKIFTNLNRI